MNYSDFSEMTVSQIILYFLIGIFNSAVLYLAYPVFLIIRKRELSEKKARKIAIRNSIVVYLLFVFLHLVTDGETANATAAITWYFIVKWMLKKFCLAKTEEAKLRSSYGKHYDQLLVDSTGIYLIKKGLVNQEITQEIADQMLNGWLQKCEYEKGKKYVKKLESFIEEANWTLLAKETNLDNYMGSSDLNSDCQEPTDDKGSDLNVAAESIITEDNDNKGRKTNSRRKKRYRLKVIIISIVSSVLLIIGVGIASLLIYEKISSYDLITSSYPQYHKFGGIYVYNDELMNSKAVRDSLYFDTDRNLYVNFLSTESLYHMQAVGFYEETDSGLYVKDSEGNIEEYIRYGGILMEKDSFYLGDVPKKEAFNGVFTFTYADGSMRSVRFRKDGTYTGLMGETGKYTRDGYKIVGVSDSNEMPQIEWLVYDGKLTHNFYKSPLMQASHHERIEYEYFHFLRDYLNMDLSVMERSFVNQYEKEHPISIK